ncbi:hypothetical protein EJB05_34077, partial [Eragrostis curvula]
MATRMAIVLMLLMSAAPPLGAKTMAGPLRYDFYKSSCPKAEQVVRKTTQEIILKNATMGAALLNMFVYDCFIEGCDASPLLAVRDDADDFEVRWEYATLRAYDAVDEIKAAVEAVCPGVVSCADIIALAARDATSIAGGFTFAMPTGRRDSLTSVPYTYEDSMPGSLASLQFLIDKFATKGLDIEDMVVLFGAHSFGMSHCEDVDRRLYPTVDPTMNATYAAALKEVCPPHSWGALGPWINNNRVTDPNVLSNQYYNNVLTGQVLFKSDQALMSRNETAAKVAYYAANPLAWKVRFAAALVRMGNIKVLTGTQGEVRKRCNVTN